MAKKKKLVKETKSHEKAESAKKEKSENRLGMDTEMDRQMKTKKAMKMLKRGMKGLARK